MGMSCSPLNSDQYKIGIVDSPSCSCGANLENVYHFFFECSNYVLLWNELQSKIIPFGSFNRKTLLLLVEGKGSTISHKEKIFEAAHRYIKSSVRFKI